MFPPEAALHVWRESEVDLEALALVAEVDARSEAGGTLRDTLSPQCILGATPKDRQSLLDRMPGAAERADEPTAVVETHIRGEDPVRGERARQERYKDPRGTDLLREKRRVDRTRPSECEEGEVPRVETPPREDRFHCSDHVRLDDPPYAEDDFVQGDSHPACKFAETLLRIIPPQRHRAPKEGRGKEARQKVRVRDRGLDPSKAIAHRPWVRPGACGPDAKRPARIDSREAPAARADGRDVDDAQGQGQAVHVCLVRVRRGTIKDDGEIRACPTHVERDEVANS